MAPNLKNNHKQYGSYKGKDAQKRELSALNAKLKVLNSLPDDFRNIPIGSAQWIHFRKLVPLKYDEMVRWSKGAIMICQKLTEKERHHLTTNGNALQVSKTVEWLEELREGVEMYTWESTLALLQEAYEENCSFIYVKNIPGFTNSMNALAQIYSWPFRFKIGPVSKTP